MLFRSPSLALLAGGIVAMTAGLRAGVAAGIAAVVLLALVRTVESRRSASGAGSGR